MYFVQNKHLYKKVERIKRNNLSMMVFAFEMQEQIHIFEFDSINVFHLLNIEKWKATIEKGHKNEINCLERIS